MVAMTPTAAEKGSKPLGGVVDLPPARCLAPFNDVPASTVARTGLASTLVEVSQLKSHYFVNVTFPNR